MKIRNVAFIAALIGWIALAVYYVTPSESAVAKEIETAPKTVGETLSAKELPKETKKNPSNQK